MRTEDRLDDPRFSYLLPLTPLRFSSNQTQPGVHCKNYVTSLSCDLNSQKVSSYNGWTPFPILNVWEDHMTGSVLIIEDDPDIAEVLRYSLEKATFKTRVALDGEDGLKACLDRKNPPAIILLDLFLPLMSGVEICRRLRLDPTTSKTPVLVITAKASELDRNRSLQIGADDYIVKPFSVRDVVQKVRTLLERSHTPES